MLERLVSINPTTRWWIKGDGTDVVKGLWQSVSGDWGGDVDLNDGKLQQLYKGFKDRLTWISNIGLNGRDVDCTKKDLQKALDTLSSDLHFVTSGKLDIQFRLFIVKCFWVSQAVYASV